MATTKSSASSREPPQRAAASAGLTCWTFWRGCRSSPASRWRARVPLRTPSSRPRDRSSAASQRAAATRGPRTEQACCCVEWRSHAAGVCEPVRCASRACDARGSSAGFLNATRPASTTAQNGGRGAHLRGGRHRRDPRHVPTMAPADKKSKSTAWSKRFLRTSKPRPRPAPPRPGPAHNADAANAPKNEADIEMESRAPVICVSRHRMSL
mmetsp:Transcript_58944/g.155021  ORF Transcript_58944/g.155021 Transcript_58944/m.155021 type:complete len:211 (-) Transcript_58944:83-715(-)